MYAFCYSIISMHIFAMSNTKSSPEVVMHDAVQPLKRMFGARTSTCGLINLTSPSLFRRSPDVAEAVDDILQRHGWGLQARHVGASLFSNFVTVEEKSRIAARLISFCPEPDMTPG